MSNIFTIEEYFSQLNNYNNTLQNKSKHKNKEYKKLSKIYDRLNNKDKKNIKLPNNKAWNDLVFHFEETFY